MLKCPGTAIPPPATRCSAAARTFGTHSFMDL